jgi:nucleoside 2-deoxyribosyltransferase
MNEEDLFAFVLMPLSDNFNDIYKFGIKEPSAQLGILAERVDEQIYTEGILERIYRQIDVADIIIADMTGQNPNVFYEVGYAHAKDKLCILLTSNSDDIPFDLKHHRHIVYNNSIKTLKEKLMEELIWAKNEIENIQKSRIKVVLKKADGKLEKTKFWADGHIDFDIDLLNETDRTSTDIEAIYFYSTKDWRLKQDGKECPSTDSDLPDFSVRHFLTPPVRKLHKGAWAQVKFKASKILAWATKGEELKDSYRVNGRSVLRLVTEQGNFDYELTIDVAIEDIPF